MVDEEKEIEDLLKDVKTIKVFRELLIVFRKNKVIFKEPLEATKHTTLQLLENDVIDAHETEEGKVKKHTSIVKIDLKKIEFERVKEWIKEELLRIVERIDLNNPSFEDIVAVVPKQKGDKILHVLGERKKKNLSFREPEEKDLEECFHIVSLKDVTKLEFELAFLYRGDELVASLYRIDEGYYIVRIERFRELSERFGELLTVQSD